MGGRPCSLKFKKKKPAFEERERRGKVCGGFLYLIVFLTSSSEEGGKVFGF